MEFWRATNPRICTVQCTDPRRGYSGDGVRRSDDNRVEFAKTMDQLTFSPDLPIASASEDRLNRSSFASALATAIRNWNQGSSLVVALYGDWGSGKSSVKNMVLESLTEGVKP